MQLGDKDVVLCSGDVVVNIEDWGVGECEEEIVVGKN